MKKNLLTKFGILTLCMFLIFTGCSKGGDNKSDSSNPGTPQSSSAPSSGTKFPTKPIRVIVPLAPGGSTDLTARTIAKVAEKYLGQPLVIENKPGGGMNIGLSELASAKPDGYTLGITNNSMVILPLFGTTQYNFATDLEAIGQVGTVPYILAVNADSPFKTLEEFVEYGKQHPDELKYGCGGLGNSTHIISEQLALSANIKMKAVVMDGGSSSNTALLGGHVQAVVQTPVDCKELVKAGKIRVLAVASDKRIESDPLYKDVPTFKEKGYDINVTLWQGFGAPKGLPDDVKNKLTEAFQKMIEDPESQKAIAELGFAPEYKNPDAFKQVWLSDQEKFKKVVTDTGILDLVKGQKK